MSGIYGIGVDILRIERVEKALARHGDRLLTRMLSEAELAEVRQRTHTARALAMCFAAKEAFVKAIGEGLSHPLDAFDVTLGADEPPRLLRLASAPGDLGRWSLYALEPSEGYAAALAVETPTPNVSTFRVPNG